MDDEEKLPLTPDQRRALHAAAEAGGFEDAFGDLLCQLAEVVGFERMVEELEKVQRELERICPGRWG